MQPDIKEAYTVFVNQIKNRLAPTHDSKTSSINELSGDWGGLSTFDRIIYLTVNTIVNDAFPESLIEESRNTEIKEFKLSLPEFKKLWNAHFSETLASPSRVMSDMFWMSLPWEKIQQKLGKINVVDLGCGRGGYAQKLTDWSEGRVQSYLGVDSQVHPRWSQSTSDNIEFRQADLNGQELSLPSETNLIVSQSFFEHVRNDLQLFQTLRDFTIRSGHPCMQIHLVPASAALKLYLMHGYRQYGPGPLKKALDIYGPPFTIKLFKLGNAPSNALHFEYITEPAYFGKEHFHQSRENNPEEYSKKLEKSLREDMETTYEDSQHCFWAIVIENEGTVF